MERGRSSLLHAINLAGGPWRWVAEFAGGVVCDGKQKLGGPLQVEPCAVSTGQGTPLSLSRPDRVRLERSFHWPERIDEGEEIRIAVRIAAGTSCAVRLNGVEMAMSPAGGGWMLTDSCRRPGTSGGHELTQLELVFAGEAAGAAVRGELLPQVELRIGLAGAGRF
jgi:hypothetical protein